MTTQVPLEQLFFLALKAYQQPGPVPGRKLHMDLRKRARGGLYDAILTGWAYAMKGQLEKAIFSYNRALKLGVDSQQLVFALKSDALMRLKRGEEALATVDEGLAVAPANFALHEAKFIFLLELHKINEIVAAYNAAFERRASAGELLLCKSLALFCLGQEEEAWGVQRQLFHQLADPSRLPPFTGNMRVHLLQYEQMLEEIRKIRPEVADVWYYRGVIEFAKGGGPGQGAGAIQSFEKALALDPAHAWAWNGRGIVLMAQSAYSEALACFAQAVSLLPIIEGFSRNRKKAARASETVASFSPFQPASGKTAKRKKPTRSKQTRQRFPAQEAPSQQMLESLMDDERFDEALSVCDRLISQARIGHGGINLEAALWLRGRILLDLERHEEAIETYRELLRLNPANTMARSELLDILMLSGRFAESLEALAPARSPNEESNEMLMRRAALLFVQQQYQEARESAATLRARDPENPLAPLIEVEALSHLGQATEALALCQEALHTIPLTERLRVLISLHQAELLLILRRPAESLPVFEGTLRQELATREGNYDEQGSLLECLFLPSGQGSGDILARVYGGMGHAWLLLQNGEKAIECFDQALSFGPDPALEQSLIQAQMLINQTAERASTSAAVEERGSLTRHDHQRTKKRLWLFPSRKKGRSQ